MFSKLLITALCLFLLYLVWIFFEEKREERVIVIKTKNSEESIEYTIRSIVWKHLAQSFGGKVPTIIVVDMGSTDKTEEIVRRLSLEYSFIKYTKNSRPFA